MFKSAVDEMEQEIPLHRAAMRILAMSTFSLRPDVAECGRHGRNARSRKSSKIGGYGPGSEVKWKEEGRDEQRKLPQGSEYNFLGSK